MNNEELIEAINCLTDAVQDNDLGTDDIYGFNPNSNLGQIAYNLDQINDTLNKLIVVLKEK